MRTRTALLAAALVTSIAAPGAHADPAHAWAAAKANLPGESAVVVGLNFTSIRKSQIFATLYPLLMSQKPDIQAGFDLAKTVCKIDPLEAIDAAVVGTDADQKTGAVYIALHNLDQDKLISCFEAVAKSKGAADTKVTIKKDGNISELSSAGTADKVYLGWIGSDVVVISFSTSDKDTLAKWMGGKGALSKSAIGKALGKIKTTASVWLAVMQDKDIDSGVHMKAAYGSIDLAGGNVSADLRVQLGAVADAAKESANFNKQLSDLLAGGAVPAAIAPLAKSVKIAQNGDEMTLKFAAAEKDVLAAIQMIMSLTGAGGSH